ncbi:MAG: DsrE/DsrF/DrsH-like family protein [Candidatus Delongbacteria bacterium]|nr:DsrE/DsrF/DrsH-like family protein [Candidatus Delongbacteria bacterium]
MSKMVITLNSSEVKTINSALTVAVSALAMGDEVIMFALPAGMPLFKKGKLHEINLASPKSPDTEEMFSGFIALGGKLMICELGFDVNGLKKEDLIEDIEIVGATTFVAAAQGSEITFSF